MNRSRWEERELCWVESGRATCSVQRALEVKVNVNVKLNVSGKMATKVPGLMGQAVKSSSTPGVLELCTSIQYGTRRHNTTSTKLKLEVSG